jgi:hypothetical protein
MASTTIESTHPAPSMEEKTASDAPAVAPTPSDSDRSLAEANGNAAQNAIEEKDVGNNAPANGPPPMDERPQRSKLKIALIMFSLCVAVLLVALDITIVTTALPTISAEFNSASGYTWVGSAYLIAQSAATPIWGKVSDIFGRKPILLVTNAIFFVGSLLAAVSVNIDMLIAARAIQGIGGGGM